MRLDRAGLGQHHAALDLFTVDAAQQDAGVVARLRRVQFLVEHLDAGHHRLHGLVAQADDLDFLALLERAALHTPRHHRAASLDQNTSSTAIRNGLSVSRTGVGM